MGTYLKLIESDKIGSNEQRSFMNHHKDQPNNGPTIYKFKNSTTNISRLAVVDKSYYLIMIMKQISHGGLVIKMDFLEFI